MPEQVVGVVGEADFSSLHKEQKKTVDGNKQIEKSTLEAAKGFDNLDKNVKTHSASMQQATKVQKQHLKTIAELVAIERTRFKTSEEARKELQQLRATLLELSTSEQRNTEAVKEQRDALRRQVFALQQVREELTRQEQAQSAAASAIERAARIAETEADKQVRAQKRAADEAERAAKRVADAQRRQRKETVALTKRALLWAFGMRTAFRALFKLRTELREAFRAVFDNTEESKRLTEAWENLRNSIVISILPFDSTRQLLAEMASEMDRLAAATLRMTEEVAGFTAAGFAVESQISSMDAESAALAEQMMGLGASLGVGKEALLGIGAEMGALGDEAQQTAEEISAMAEANKKLEHDTALATAALKDYSSTIKSLIGIQRQFNDFLGQQADKLREAQDEFASATSTARATFMGDIVKIDTDFNKRVVEINQDALDDRQKAFKDFNKRVAQAQKRANRDLERERQRHQLEMAFAQRRFLLTGIQNERIFLFERGRLVAQGDVLAVEELDARNELQKQAAEENFRLQMELSEAQFRLQQRIQRETNREMVADLRDALGEQLKAIEEERKEEIQEARDAATEQRTEAATAAGERFADAALALKAEEKQLEESFARKIDDAAQWAVDFAREHELGVEGAVAVAETAFGRNATMERIIRETWDITEQRTQTWSNFMVQRLKAVEQQANATAAALGAVAESANFSIQGITGGSSRGFRDLTPLPGRGRQFGGEDIVSRPTTFTAGEGGMPERVTVEPLSSIGGSFSLGWRGGAIPINVTGGTEGADMAPIGQEIAQGLIIELQNQLAGFRGTRGR